MEVFAGTKNLGKGASDEFTDTEAFGTLTTSTSSFTITGGGAKYQISPFMTGAGLVNIGIPTIAATNLGNGVDGYLSTMKSGGTNDFSTKNFATAETIVNESIKQISVLRGRLGAFQKDTVETNMNSMQVALENVTASESVLRDADMAEEVSKLTLAQILVQSTIQVLGIANQTPSSVLQLVS